MQLCRRRQAAGLLAARVSETSHRLICSTRTPRCVGTPCAWQRSRHRCPLRDHSRLHLTPRTSWPLPWQPAAAAALPLTTAKGQLAAVAWQQVASTGEDLQALRIIGCPALLMDATWRSTAAYMCRTHLGALTLLALVGQSSPLLLCQQRCRAVTQLCCWLRVLCKGGCAQLGAGCGLKSAAQLKLG